MIGPGGYILIGALTWVCTDGFRSGAESGERDHAVGIIVAEQDRLNARAPFRDLATSDIVAVARGVALCIRYHGGRVAASIRSGLNHPVGGVAASGGGRYPGVIRLRERKTIHAHRFGGDVRCRQGVVALTFRSVMILYPLCGSQVPFINCYIFARANHSFSFMKGSFFFAFFHKTPQLWDCYEECKCTV